MGEVYRATDTMLNRDVALKILPEEFAKDHDRMARFKREAQVLASLNHPNIAAIYGLEQEGDIQAISMELVEGPTLRERIKQGALPLDEALNIAKQIAEALESAHEQGVIHRDLKPANLKVREDGQVKVLDFGLAKALEGEMTEEEIGNSPTLSVAATRAGVILGTAAYMSPEQARGQKTDRRADIWSFGVVLFEMLTGQRLFTGESAVEVMSKVMRDEPDWDALPASTPATIRKLLRRCLTKDRKQRLHAIADVRFELEEAIAEPTSAWLTPAAASSPQANWRPGLPWVIAALMALISAAALWGPWSTVVPSPKLLARLVVPLPPTENLAIRTGPAVAISRDGSRLVYVVNIVGTTQLYLRPMDQLEATPIAGTEGAFNPFFSPDGQWVGFFSAGKMKKVSIMGGEPVTLADAPNPKGASWGPDGTIIFTPTYRSSLLRVSAAGGTPEAAIPPDAADTRRFPAHWPEVLPGGKAVIFTIVERGSYDDARIAVQSLETGELRVLVKGGSNPRYVPTGHIVYSRAGVLLAAPFDLSQLKLTGEPVPILEGILGDPSTGTVHFSFSSTGSLVYVPVSALAGENTLVWVDRQGQTRPVTETRRLYTDPRLSPDGRRLAITVNGSDVWVYEMARGALTRLTFDGSDDFEPVWTPDGKRVTFTSTRAGQPNLFWKAADGCGATERLTTSEHPQFSNAWSPDGQELVFSEYNPQSGLDLWVLPLEDDHKPGKARLILQTPFNEFTAQFSPDGRWLAYVSDESGRNEIYVRPYPGPRQKWLISTEGGAEPLWAPNGPGLFYRKGDKMMAVAITTEPQFTATKPRLLFEGRYKLSVPGYTNYSVNPDGKRFLMIKSEQEAAPTQLHIVFNWFEELRRRVPAN